MKTIRTFSLALTSFCLQELKNMATANIKNKERYDFYAFTCIKTQLIKLQINMYWFLYES